MSKPHQEPDILQSLLSLPLFDNVFYSMQAQNVAIVDVHLKDLEAATVREYMQTDRLPLPEIMLLSALSQFWIFGVYELLRTWRQRAKELLDFYKKLSEIGDGPKATDRKKELKILYQPRAIPSKVSQDFVDVIYGKELERIETDRDFVKALQISLDRVTLRFRRLEALRITLAKHEIKGERGLRACAPGYARIDHITNSLCWMVEYKDGSSEIISRQSIVKELESIACEK